MAELVALIILEMLRRKTKSSKIVHEGQPFFRFHSFSDQVERFSVGRTRTSSFRVQFESRIFSGRPSFPLNVQLPFCRKTQWGETDLIRPLHRRVGDDRSGSDRKLLRNLVSDGWRKIQLIYLCRGQEI